MTTHIEESQAEATWIQTMRGSSGHEAPFMTAGQLATEHALQPVADQASPSHTSPYEMMAHMEAKDEAAQQIEQLPTEPTISQEVGEIA